MLAFTSAPPVKVGRYDTFLGPDHCSRAWSARSALDFQMESDQITLHIILHRAQACVCKRAESSQRFTQGLIHMECWHNVLQEEHSGRAAAQDLDPLLERAAMKRSASWL